MSGTFTRRIGALCAAVAFFTVTTVLLLADRSGSVVGIVRALVVDTGREVEASYGVDWFDRKDIPGSADQMGHAVLWGSGMVLIGWMLRRRVPLPITALFLGGVSLLYESAQPLVSSTRAFQPSDGTANLVGIVVAATALGVALWLGRRLLGVGQERLAHVEVDPRGW